MLCLRASQQAVLHELYEFANFAKPTPPTLSVYQINSSVTSYFHNAHSNNFTWTLLKSYF